MRVRSNHVRVGRYPSTNMTCVRRTTKGQAFRTHQIPRAQHAAVGVFELGMRGGQEKVHKGAKLACLASCDRKK